MPKMNTLEMTAGNVFNLQGFEQNKIKSKQRSFEDFIGTSFVLIDADLLLIWMNKFQPCVHFHGCVVPGLVCRVNNFASGVYIYKCNNLEQFLKIFLIVSFLI